MEGLLKVTSTLNLVKIMLNVWSVNVAVTVMLVNLSLFNLLFLTPVLLYRALCMGCELCYLQNVQFHIYAVLNTNAMPHVLNIKTFWAYCRGVRHFQWSSTKALLTYITWRYLRGLKNCWICGN